MTDEIKLGAEIPVDGMPDWIGDDEILAAKWKWTDEWYSGGTAPKDCYASPEGITAIRLPADHPYYLATSRGFTYWPGGEDSPEVSEVLLRNGATCAPVGIYRWDHRGKLADVIGYRNQQSHYTEYIDTTSVTITPMTVEEATAALYNIPTLRALGLIREDTTLERFEKAYGFMTTRERDTVGAFIEWQDSLSA